MHNNIQYLYSALFLKQEDLVHVARENSYLRFSKNSEANARNIEELCHRYCKWCIDHMIVWTTTHLQRVKLTPKHK